MSELYEMLRLGNNVFNAQIYPNGAKMITNIIINTGKNNLPMIILPAQLQLLLSFQYYCQAF